MTLISSYRMYHVNDVVAGLWADFFDAVAAAADVEVVPFQHAPPARIDALWTRKDMGLVMMCGWPFARADPQPVALAAPVTAGGPGYWSDMICRVDAPFARIEDTFGHRIAWTVAGSHSGYNAPRKLLLPHVAKQGAPLFSQTVGPVVSPRGAIDAVLNGAADVAPLDGYFHLLLQRHEPETAAQLKVVARTPVAPMPLLVASSGAPVAALRDALLSAHEFTDLTGLAIERFAPVVRQDYQLGNRWAAEAAAAGYEHIT